MAATSAFGMNAISTFEPDPDTSGICSPAWTTLRSCDDAVAMASMQTRFREQWLQARFHRRSLQVFQKAVYHTVFDAPRGFEPIPLVDPTMCMLN